MARLEADLNQDWLRLPVITKQTKGFRDYHPPNAFDFFLSNSHQTVTGYHYPGHFLWDDEYFASMFSISQVIQQEFSPRKSILVSVDWETKVHCIAKGSNKVNPKEGLILHNGKTYNTFFTSHISININNQKVLTMLVDREGFFPQSHEDNLFYKLYPKHLLNSFEITEQRAFYKANSRSGTRGQAVINDYPLNDFFKKPKIAAFLQSQCLLMNKMRKLEAKKLGFEIE